MTNAALAMISFLWSVGGLFTRILDSEVCGGAEVTELVVAHLSFRFYFRHGVFQYGTIQNLSTGERAVIATLAEMELAGRTAAANFAHQRQFNPETVRAQYPEWYAAAVGCALIFGQD